LEKECFAKLGQPNQRGKQQQEKRRIQGYRAFANSIEQTWKEGKKEKGKEIGKCVKKRRRFFSSDIFELAYFSRQACLSDNATFLLLFYYTKL